MNSKDNKYFKWYWNICDAAKDRILESSIYTEDHHIYPKSIYGEGETVKLSAKEHYMVHLLLWRGFRFKYGANDEKTVSMAGAFACMNMKNKSTKQRYNSKLYSLLKIASSESQKYRIITKETRKKIGEKSKGNKHNLGRKCSENAKELLSKKMKGKQNRLGVKDSEETKKRKSEKLKGNKYRLGVKDSEETKKRKSENNKGKKNYFFGKHFIHNTIYTIETPMHDIIKIETRAKVREFLGCSDAFFIDKQYHEYKLLDKEK